jgi:uncharacterized membrane protein YebE (DUF533 family)
MDSFRILRFWAACAWSDGELHPAELAALERFIDASGDLSADELLEARTFLQEPTDVDVATVKQLPAESREGVYRAALDIVKLDRQVTDDERAFLGRLRAALDLDEATIERIEAQ